MKKIVRLTENDLIKIVKRVIKENEDNKLKRYVEEEDELFGFDPDDDEDDPTAVWEFRYV